jgi:hypothetical protein
MAVSPAPLAGGGAFIAGAPALTPFRRNGAGHPPPPHRTSGIPLGAGEGSRRTTHPRSPALNSVIEGSGILTRGWRLRLWAPFSSSDFLFLLPFFCLTGRA